MAACGVNVAASALGRQPDAESAKPQRYATVAVDVSGAVTSIVYFPPVFNCLWNLGSLATPRRTLASLSRSSSSSTSLRASESTEINVKSIE